MTLLIHCNIVKFFLCGNYNLLNFCVYFMAFNHDMFFEWNYCTELIFKTNFNIKERENIVRFEIIINKKFKTYF